MGAIIMIESLSIQYDLKFTVGDDNRFAVYNVSFVAYTLIENILKVYLEKVLSLEKEI